MRQNVTFRRFLVVGCDDMLLDTIFVPAFRELGVCDSAKVKLYSNLANQCQLTPVFFCHGFLFVLDCDLSASARDHCKIESLTALERRKLKLGKELCIFHPRPHTGERLR